MKITSGVTYPFAENVKHDSRSMLILHAGDVQVAHGLGYVPACVLVTGRVEVVQVVRKTGTDLVFRARLLSARKVSPVQGVSQTIIVDDASLFQVGDQIALGNYTRRIQNIYQNELTLDASVVCDTFISIHLASTSVSITIF